MSITPGWSSAPATPAKESPPTGPQPPARAWNILDVAGNVRANQVVINTSGADFVFDKHYHLPSLHEIARYIDKNHHLPGVASAKEMQTNGMNIGDNQTLLLQKVEELTLYMIDLKKENEELKARLVKLENTEK